MTNTQQNPSTPTAPADQLVVIELMKGRKTLMRRMSAYVVAGLMILAVGCGGDSPTAPTPPPPFSFNGTWTGPIISNVPGVPPGTGTVTITHTGSSLSGTWATVYPDSTFNSAGSFSGTASGMSLVGMLSPSIPTDCPYTINAAVSGNLMTGTYASFNCSGVLSGTISLTKQ